jgi:carbamoyl-phosphate synthase large subunit
VSSRFSRAPLQLDKKLIYFEDWEDNLLMLRYDDEVLIRNYNE